MNNYVILTHIKSPPMEIDFEGVVRALINGSVEIPTTKLNFMIRRLELAKQCADHARRIPDVEKKNEYLDYVHKGVSDAIAELERISEKNVADTAYNTLNKTSK